MSYSSIVAQKQLDYGFLLLTHMVSNKTNNNDSNCTELSFAARLLKNEKNQACLSIRLGYCGEQ